MSKKIKYLNYRRPSLSSKCDPFFATEDRAARELAYKMWLLGREAPHAGSNRLCSDTLKAWKTWIADNMTPEVQATLDRQAQDELDQHRRAQRACERAGELLAEYGFGAFVQPSTAWRTETVMKPCANCAGTGALIDGEICCLCEGTKEYLSEQHIEYPCMYCSHGYYTDGSRFIYIGTQRARGYTAQQRKPVQLIIESGRDPDDSELRAMIDELLGEQLELAA